MLWLYISFIFYTINGLLWKWAVQTEHPIELINRRALFTVAFVVVAMLITRTSMDFIFLPGFYFILLASLFGTIGLILMVYFLKSGTFTRLSYYSFLGLALNSGITLLTGSQQLTPMIIIAGLILISGYILFVWDENRNVKKEPVLLSQHLLLGLMTLSFSASTIFNWLALDRFSTLQVMVVQELFVLAGTGFISLFFMKKKLPFLTAFKARYPIMAVVIMLAVFTGLLSLSQLNPLITAINGVISPLLTLVAAVIIFKEKMNRVQLASLAIIVIGEIIFFSGK